MQRKLEMQYLAQKLGLLPPIIVLQHQELHKQPKNDQGSYISGDWDWGWVGVASMAGGTAIYTAPT